MAHRWDTVLRVFDANMTTQITYCDDCGTCGTATTVVHVFDPGEYNVVVEVCVLVCCIVYV